MLSQKRQKELTKASEEAKETVNFITTITGSGSLNIDWYIVLGYLSAENLVKHSKNLTRLTIVLAVFALGMIGLAIWQLLVLLAQG